MNAESKKIILCVFIYKKKLETNETQKYKMPYILPDDEFQVIFKISLLLIFYALFWEFLLFYLFSS